ncbi:NADPH-dependent FMN reductase [Actinoalloteichus hymeniacidonis]|uniref:Flavoprotein n=1 Tax=Actinoalloteichus hymeniacidonis TaxID=340345 RepID=A0AAC9HN62_9PSEU|nr:NAD(P)H-dependent oxidoreductase [Actinoalloteichus hymeniacidonis]AOS62244.1 putative flavoprotein [Actinoalloteichus hymeniacidonis]MBB5909730.1 NAD(P)H-dependent FMN reductase [Actinoalloteichus hymeniacidonis]
MTRIAVIVGSTRTHRRGKAVADWTLTTARQHAPAGVELELVDLAEFDLPVLDEPASGAWGVYAHEHTKRWSEAIASFDGYVIVTPEYNHGVPGPLKNALDYLYYEWNHKAVGFVGYGTVGGVRAVEQLRQIVADFKLADVATQVTLNTFTDFDYTGIDITEPTITGVFAPADRHVTDLARLLEEVTVWSCALQPVRAQAVES